MSCSSKHKIAVQGVLGCMILLLGFWHIRYSYANKLNNKACTMADSEKAMRTIEKAIKLNPMNPVYYANMGLLYAATDTAINLRNYMALSKVSSEALDKSLAYFHLANNMAPKNRLFSLNLGLLYALNGKYLKAKSFFEKAVENSDEEENVLLWALFCERFRPWYFTCGRNGHMCLFYRIPFIAHNCYAADSNYWRCSNLYWSICIIKARRI